MSTRAPPPIPAKIPKTARIAIAAARFNGKIVDQLLADCEEYLHEAGLADGRLKVVRVPGAFELPLAAKALCQTGRYDAVICLGAVIRGETPHFDFVASNCAAGVREVAMEFSTPVLFGVLTTNTEKQAWARTRGPHSHTGIRTAEAACEMIAVMREIRSATGRKA